MSGAARRIDISDIRVSVGDRFKARSPGGFRSIQVERVHSEAGCIPTIQAREIVSCSHAALRALAGGTCPVCPTALPTSERDLFAVTLTGVGGVWQMPIWYVAT